MRVLIVEDNPKMATAIQSGLNENGFAADVSNTGFEGEEMAAIEPYDVIILDLMLPDRDGVEICRNLRRRKVKTPVIMLTALSSTDDKVTGLNAGADDYIAKPFEFEELLARIRAAPAWRGDGITRPPVRRSRTRPLHAHRQAG
ncbi:MAG: response regulator transcription factor [Phycisphaerales bacterium]